MGALSVESSRGDSCEGCPWVDGSSTGWVRGIAGGYCALASDRGSPGYIAVTIAVSFPVGSRKHPKVHLRFSAVDSLMRGSIQSSLPSWLGQGSGSEQQHCVLLYPSGAVEGSEVYFCHIVPLYRKVTIA